MSERVPIEVTRQDRIYCLKASSDYHSELCEECRFYPNCDHTTQDDLTELNIKDLEVLEQEPTTKNDLGVDWESYKDIDGNSLDDLILEVLQNNFDCGNTYGYKVADEIIGLLPSVTPQEPRKGHWIGHREHCENLGVMPSGLGAYEWCSNCDCGIDVREWHRNHYNFCPNCGADMREILKDGKND